MYSVTLPRIRSLAPPPPYKVPKNMAPFSATDTLPFVKDMVEASSAWGWSGLGYH